MSDLISREAAIDAIAEMYCKSDEDGYVWIIRGDACLRIDALPSVDAVEVVRCRNCEWWCKDPDEITYCELNSTRCGGNHFCSLGVQKVMEETDD